jgi:hypothetical protein
MANIRCSSSKHAPDRLGMVAAVVDENGSWVIDSIRCQGTVKKTLGIALICVSPLCWGNPDTYSAGPTTGTVVDADSHEPIAGAVVIAIWQLEGGMHRDVIGTFRVAEDVTDGSGQYRIPAWGPLPRPANGVLDAYDPLIYVFKSGYSISSLQNSLEQPKARSNIEKHDSVFNGRPIVLYKFAKSPKAYSMQVASFVGANLEDILSRGCRWKEIPNAIRVLETEGKREVADNLHPLFTVKAERLLARKECAPFDDFLSKYNKKEGQ